ncbi:precorrin-2 C(20)-methyltransferase [Gloeobacter morelensis]|uniref:Precorrin-2 C(20)-methyltransferase n=1 Tax=Gloeobacter morelensis MG652769 TaxID=2781736 RepID=A0ABY3PQE9_9CYAN|nr:precorrin-2 C(20)-methyltransferase [Gloeobacter morelensis]UFP95911.1 precorrin-2 C(20)-methyltransferase [Gloeobacter morelensis MG652769]
MNVGTLYGIGVGPGDPELLTLKGLRVLRSAAVVACPADRTGGPGLAARIAAPHLRREQRLTPLYLPFVSDEAVLAAAWSAAADALYADLALGLDVAFISEGDVSLFSTFTYILREFQERYAQVAVRIIPGIASPLAAAAALQLPLAIGDETLTILPAMHRIEELEAACTPGRTVVLLKVAAVYEQVYTWLKAWDRLDQAHLLCWVSAREERIYRRLPVAPERLPYFSLLIIRPEPEARR